MPGASQANVLADVVAILTGTTDKTTLSASCSQENTYIVSGAGTPAGWEAVTGGLNGFVDSTLPVSGLWTDIAWNGSVYCAIQKNSNIALTSPDGTTWTQKTLPSSAPWSRIVWNGTVFCAIAGTGTASTACATSPDGITWTSGTLPVSQLWGTLVWNGTIFVAAAKEGSSSTVATSTDGRTWTSRTLPVAGYCAGIAWSGTQFCAVFGWSNLSTLALTSPDGITWTQRTLPSNAYWQDIVWNGVEFFAIAMGTGASSADGITWTTQTVPSYWWMRIFWTGSAFMAFSGEANANMIASSANGVDWVTTLHPTTNIGWQGAAWNSTAKRLLVLGYTTTTANPNLFTVTTDYNKHLRALNANGTSYKYVNLDVADPTHLLLRAAELFNGFYTTNLCYNSDNPIYSQQLDLTNGGIVYIAATARYLYLFSFKTATSTWGYSATGTGFTGLSELSRDDLWNTNYPPYAFVCSNASGFGQCYLPRIKGNTADETGLTAYLGINPNYPMTKQVIAADGTTPVHLAVDIKLSNTTQFTYTVLGGTMLGGVKRTTDSIGLTTDEMTISTATYVLWKGSGSSGSFSFLVPKI